MRDYFDTIAWLVGLGFWIAGAIALFVAISEFNLLRLRSLPKIARQLGSLDGEKRRKAFEQLLTMGQSAVDTFLQVLQAKELQRQFWLLRVWGDLKPR